MCGMECGKGASVLHMYDSKGETKIGCFRPTPPPPPRPRPLACLLCFVLRAGGDHNLCKSKYQFGCTPAEFLAKPEEEEEDGEDGEEVEMTEEQAYQMLGMLEKAEKQKNKRK